MEYFWQGVSDTQTLRTTVIYIQAYIPSGFIARALKGRTSTRKIVSTVKLHEFPIKICRISSGKDGDIVWRNHASEDISSLHNGKRVDIWIR